MATYRLFSSVSEPSNPVSYTGPFLAGVLFQVTTGGVWFDGYWWWFVIQTIPQPRRRSPYGPSTPKEKA